ncbi:hypothetical protein AAFC00_000471 [Neodothiora populina]|uniref:ABC transporter n=1 Tax=Neodothiora populina TaxID=2781224 RepID=A0ABR3PD02_9PEZI
MPDEGSSWIATWTTPRRTTWFRPFVEEPTDDNEVDYKVTQRLPYAAICLLIISAGGLSIQVVTSIEVLPAIAPSILWALSALGIAFRRPRTASVALLLTYSIIFALQLVFFASHWDQSSPARWYKQSPLDVLALSNAILSFLACIIVVNMPLRQPDQSQADISRPFTTPSHDLRSPEDNLTLLQWMTVSWMSSLIRVGTERQLHDEDVWQLGYEFQHRHLHDAFKDLKGTVVIRLLRANWIDLAILAILAIVELVANYSTPVLLQNLLEAMDRIDLNRRPAITFAVLILTLRLVAAQSAVFSLWFGRRCYERSRGEMITMLFEKTLNRKIIGSVNNEGISTSDDAAMRNGQSACPDQEDPIEDESGEDSALLNGSIKKSSGHGKLTSRVAAKIRALVPFKMGKQDAPKKEPASMGKILNLMRGDVYEVAQRFWEFQSIINKPLGLLLSVILVWRLIGWPCLIGISVVIIAQCINALLVRQLIKNEKARRAATDVKLQQISQYVEAIRHLRWYGWHPTWFNRIMGARQKELKLKVLTNIWDLAIIFFNMLGSGILPVASFWAYTALAGHQLRVSVAFPALQLFILLQGNLRDIPGLITVLLNANVAVGRIEDFMAEPDRAHLDIEGEPSGIEQALEVKDASFAWPGLSRNVLRNVTLSFPTGLTVISGPVASGKTALLQALLGELDLRGGQLHKPKTPVAYCAQSPWLQSMSIRDNILFGSPYDEVRYKQTLDACALVSDFANFQHGDLSPIGENGIGLSGGQKARVALARAVYSRANILMLDDPLSALDQQTAEAIVSKCLAGDLTKDRVVILVTHRTDLCRGIAEHAIEIVNGTARVVDDDEMTDGSNIPQAGSDGGTLVDGSSDEAQEAAAVPDKFTEDEHRKHGGVQFKVYWQYVKAGKLKWWAFVILGAAFCRLVRVLESWFLKEWGEAYNEAGVNAFVAQRLSAQLHMQSSPVSGFFSRFPNPSDNVKPWLIGYLLIAIAQATGFLVLQSFMLVVIYSAGRQMFRDIMKRVSYTTFRYYDVTPVGRLMNRLTSDVGTIDGNISDKFLNVVWQSIAWVSAVVVIASITPIFLIFSMALTIAFVFVFLRFLPTSQSLRRLEMVSLSPLMSNFGALLDGLTTVRAFCAQSQFQDRVIAVTDNFQKMDHFYWSLQSWLMYRFDILSGCSTFILTILAIYSGLTSGLTAFVLVSASSFVRATHEICKQYGQLQLDFVSVERVVELLHLEQEPKGSIDPPAWWPSYESDIIFEDVTIRYAPHLEPALSGISFQLKGGTNTAVIGRTGSGKSTLALALLATITPESGRILIGGIDISKADKQALRTRITFLAQDPVLFPGSLRHNLDPTEEHSDEACEAVIARVCPSYQWTLDTQIDTGGKNLSQGQRQLVGLARAILRRSAIVIMDEATASIDMDTAWKIQRVLREEMKGSTVITIAHRPSAVRDAEYCLALGNGKVIGEGSPAEVGEMVFGQSEVAHGDETPGRT